MDYQKTKIFILALLFGLGSSNATALPTQGTVNAGGAAISTPTANAMEIHQSTNKAIINWQSFAIDSNQSVQFFVPTSDAMTLNRVTGGNPSEILGSLNSNGQLWLINPNGVLFGQNAQVNVAGLMASTLNITDHDFMSGNYHFQQEGSQLAKVINQGHITADDQGYVAFLAPQIENSGFISARLGTVALAAGTAATVQFSGNSLLNVAVANGVEVPMYDESGNPVAAIKHSGEIHADGGYVLMTAKSVNTLLDQSINVTGIVKADSVQEKNGSIILTASGNTILDNATVSAQGIHSGEKGGSIKIMGENVALLNHTEVNASGANGGGDIRIGHDNRDPNGSMANVTVISKDVSLQAQATQSGDGGVIETSGHYLRAQSGHINTLGAQGGKNGTWLLDPYSLTISNSSDSNVSSNPFEPTTGDANLSVTTLLTALGNSDVTIQTGNDAGAGSGDITVSDAINYTGSSNRMLTLNAAGDININADISDTTAGALSLGLWTANNIGYSSVQGNINIHGAVSVAGSGGAGSAGNTNLKSAQAIQLGDINTSGYLYVTAGGAITQAANTALVVSGLANFDTGGTGDVTLDNAGNNFSTLGAYAANVVLRDTDALQLDAVTAQNLTVTAGGDLTQVASPTTGITVNGLTQLNVGTSHDITLTNADGNNNPINTINQLSIDAANNVSVSTQTALDLAQQNATSLGSLTVNTYGGAVTQSTALNVLGATTIDTTNGASAQDITLTTSGNNFNNQTLSLTGANISLTDTNSAIKIGLLRSEGTGNTILTAAGGISDSGGGIDMTRGASSGRTATFNLIAGGSGNIDLSGDNAFNNNEVIVGSSGTAPGTVTIKDGYNSLMVGTINAGALTLETTQANASIGQASGTAITATGITTVTAGSAIDLSNTGNDFNTLLINGGNNVAIVDSSAVTLGATDITGNLTLTTGGDVTQTAAVNVGGKTTLDAGTHDITLTSSGNNLSGPVSLSGHDISLTQAGGNLTLDQIIAQGDVTLLNQNGNLIFGANHPPLQSGGNVTLVANQFINNYSANNPLNITGNGRWLFYLSNYTGNTFGLLTTTNTPIWNTVYPTGITAPGNSYVFAVANPNPNPTVNNAIPTMATLSANNPEVVSQWVNKNVNSNMPKHKTFKKCITGLTGLAGEQICNEEQESIGPDSIYF